jgi:hypothetical protein
MTKTGLRAPHDILIDEFAGSLRLSFCVCGQEFAGERVHGVVDVNRKRLPRQLQ